VLKGISQMASLMGKLPKIQEEFARFQAKAADIVAEGKSGGDMVTVKANGKFAIISCRISEEAMRQQDREMLEDLIRAATNQALEKVRSLLAEEAQRVAGEIGLPAGFNLPGLM
jgi:nucleoid-associated protein EbfC